MPKNNTLHTFVVESPFQILSATEARHFFALSDDDVELVVLVPAEPNSRLQVQRAVEFTRWSRVRTLPPRGLANQPLRLHGVRKLANEKGRIFWIGNYGSLLMHQLWTTEPCRLLDDGAGTIAVNDMRLRGQRGQTMSGFSWRDRAKRSAVRVFGLDRPEPTRVDFFTMYDLDTAPLDRCTHHDFPWLRNRFTARPIGEHSLFLGSSIVEFSTLGTAEWARLVDKACHHVGTSTSYLPHRRESSATLKALAQAGVTLSQLQGPVEIDLAEAEALPRVVAGFFSTAFHVLARLLPPEVELRAFRLPLDAIGNSEQRRDLERTYEQLPTLTHGRVVVEGLE